MNYLGRHIILELNECPESLLVDCPRIQSLMEGAAREMGATIVESRFHHFSPLGVSGVVIIMESHLTVHTWPEYRYAAVDIFTCGDIDLERGTDFLVREFGAQEVKIESLDRGALGKQKNPGSRNEAAPES